MLDFGIAKIVEDEGSPELTGAGDLVGTPAYMSPEQIRGGFERDGKTQDIDGRSDLYSTGVVLYHLLTGALPFRGSKMALLAAHLNNAPLPMKEANPRAEVPPDVERVVLRCLEKESGPALSIGHGVGRRVPSGHTDSKAEATSSADSAPSLGVGGGDSGGRDCVGDCRCPFPGGIRRRELRPFRHAGPTVKPGPRDRPASA